MPRYSYKCAVFWLVQCVATTHKQRTHSLNGGHVGTPACGLLLFEKPLLHEGDGLTVIRRDFIKGLDKQRLCLDRPLIPPPARYVVAPVHAHLVAVKCALLDTADDVERLLVVTATVEHQRQRRAHI